MVVGTALAVELERSADSRAATVLVERMAARHHGVVDRLEADEALRKAVVAVGAASPHLSRLLVSEPGALEVLSRIDAPTALLAVHTAGDVDSVSRAKRLELLRIAARDLCGLDELEAVGRQLSDLADAVLGSASRIGDPDGGLCVIAMGKLGARELNYASDIDVMFVGEGDARRLLQVAGTAWRVDAGLRPEGRNGPLTRSLSSFEAYWEKWAQTWEFQALLKARFVAGDPALGAAFMASSTARLWQRPFGADELRAVRSMKARSEGQVARRGLANREIKRGRGGIRDIEFAVQLLQLVHGRDDADLRVPGTLPALAELAAAGYVGSADARSLESAYRFLRTVEHRLQLVEDQQVHAVPARSQGRTQLARVLGFRDTTDATALELFDDELSGHQATARGIHERLFFRPLLEAFGAGGTGRRAGLSAEAAEERFAAFGFSDADRTHQALRELTQGFSRSSRLMQQMLPLLLEWLSESPDPDLGLLGLRALTTGRHRRDQVTTAFRESPEAARNLSALLGTSALFRTHLERHPDLIGDMGGDSGLRAMSRADIDSVAEQSLAWRTGPARRRHGLLQLQQRQWVRIAARDTLGMAEVVDTGASLANLAEVVMARAIREIAPPVPFAVIAMGRFGGGELSYASDLDVLCVYEGASPAEFEEAEAAATSLVRYVNGETPAGRLYTLDLELRPEGRKGPLARSLDAYRGYYGRWADTWERQALLRGRFVAGDPDVGRRFSQIAEDFLRGAPVTADDVRQIRRIKARIEHERIPAGEDPRFHLKLGRGSLSDVEWTAQLLQLQHGVQGEGTIGVLNKLEAAGIIEHEDAAVLTAAYRFCERTRNRLYLVRGAAGDSLPTTGHTLTVLATSLGTTPAELREEYRRRTRRARQVVERLFYGRV
jgi:glutamate-ammonia-ligase adenylyltransferase